MPNSKWRHWVEWNRVLRTRDEKLGIIIVYMAMKAVVLHDILGKKVYNDKRKAKWPSLTQPMREKTA